MLLTKEILISQTGDLKETCQSFLTELDSLYSKYLSRMETIEQEWEVEFDNGNFDNAYFYPEKLSIKSPLTIIDAPWGTGKTYFIETLAKFFINKETDKEQFKIKNIVIIDTWQHVNSDNVPNDIARKLANVLTKFLNFSEKSKILNSEMLNIFLADSPTKNVCHFLFFYIKSLVFYFRNEINQNELKKYLLINIFQITKSTTKTNENMKNYWAKSAQT